MTCKLREIRVGRFLRPTEPQRIALFVNDNERLNKRLRPDSEEEAVEGAYERIDGVSSQHWVAAVSCRSGRTGGPGTCRTNWDEE